MLLLALLVSLVRTVATQELLENADMESLGGWVCSGFTCTLTSTSHSGSFAIQASGRTGVWQGPSQYVPVESNKTYSVSVWVRIVSEQQPQNLVVTFQFEFQDGTSKYRQVTPWISKSAADEWSELKGDFTGPDKALQRARLYIEGPVAGVDFIADHASLLEHTAPSHQSCDVVELLENGDMETTTGWGCSSFTCVSTSQAHSGAFAIQTSGRTATWQGPSQSVGVESSKTYTFSIWVHLVNDLNGQTDQSVRATAKFTYQDGTNHYHAITNNPNVRTADGWVQLKGDFTVPAEPLQSTTVYVEGPDADVDFITDDASLVETATASCGTGNLFENPDMESLVDWACWGFTCSLTNTQHNGNSAILASGRSGSWQGPQQYAYLDPGKLYSVSVWVKLVNDLPGQLGQKIYITTNYKFSDGTEKYKQVAVYGLLRVADGWVKLAGNVQVPDKPLDKVRFYVEGPDRDANFIVDEASLLPLAEWTNWRQEVDNNINQIRRSSIHIQVTTAADVNPSEVTIQIRQTKKAFPFGTAISCSEYDSGDTRYQDFINEHFNWAVTENRLKWPQMERTKGDIRYEPALSAIKKLKSNGIKVRAHNIVWSVEKSVPSWVRPLYNDSLKEVVHDRVVDIVDKTKTLVEHWDVNNENLHGYFFQQHVHDVDYNLDVFNLAHNTAPNVKMFLNEFDVVSGGATTQAYLNQAVKFKQANVGLYGIGVQCHFIANEMPSPTLIKAHLDTLAQAGVPIWVTELDVGSLNETERADFYETALRVLYGHPAVEGILLWGFWSERHWRREEGALVSGPEFTLNAAGQRVLDLLEKQWMTNKCYVLSQSETQFTVDGFHGDYEVKVIYQGQELVDQRKTFTLGTSAHSISLSVD